jgi:hypothetical protein
LFQTFTGERRVQRVLINKIRDRWPELLSVSAQQLFDHRFILVNRTEEAVSSLCLEQQFGGFRVLLPDFARNERRVNYNKIERMMQVSWQIFWLIKVVENEPWILAECFIKLEESSQFARLHQGTWLPL